MSDSSDDDIITTETLLNLFWGTNVALRKKLKIAMEALMVIYQESCPESLSYFKCAEAFKKIAIIQENPLNEQLSSVIGSHDA